MSINSNKILKSFREHHRTEMALVKVTMMILLAAVIYLCSGFARSPFCFWHSWPQYSLVEILCIQQIAVCSGGFPTQTVARQNQSKTVNKHVTLEMRDCCKVNETIKAIFCGHYVFIHKDVASKWLNVTCWVFLGVFLNYFGLKTV